MARDTQGKWQYMREAGELAVIGLTLVFATAIGYFLGHQVELAWPEWNPWGGVVGAMPRRGRFPGNGEDAET